MNTPTLPLNIKHKPDFFTNGNGVFYLTITTPNGASIIYCTSSETFSVYTTLNAAQRGQKTVCKKTQIEHNGTTYNLEPQPYETP
jgi:hypothetical protein